jgi:hypothetical protein
MARPSSRHLSLLATTSLLLALTLSPGVAGAASNTDSASGNVNFASQQIDFSARSTNVNTDASGRIRLTFTAFDPNQVYVAEVTCMRVVGATETTAATVVISGRITQQPPGGTAQSIIVNASDSGKFSNVADGAFAFTSSTPSPPDSMCPAPIGFVNTVADGEVVIKNALP